MMKSMLAQMNERSVQLAVRAMNALRRREGQGMAEYGIVIALVAVVAAVAIKLFGAALSEFFTNKVIPLVK